MFYEFDCGSRGIRLFWQMFDRQCVERGRLQFGKAFGVDAIYSFECVDADFVSIE